MRAKMEEKVRVNEVERRVEEHDLHAQFEELKRKSRIRKLQMHLSHLSKEVISETAQHSMTNKVIREDKRETQLPYHTDSEYIEPEAT